MRCMANFGDDAEEARRLRARAIVAGSVLFSSGEEFPKSFILPILFDYLIDKGGCYFTLASLEATALAR